MSYSQSIPNLNINYIQRNNNKKKQKTTPNSNRKKNKSKEFEAKTKYPVRKFKEKFSASIEYFNKLHEWANLQQIENTSQSNPKTPIQQPMSPHSPNQNNTNKKPAFESQSKDQEKYFSLTNNNTRSNSPVNLPKKIISFLNTMSNLQAAINNKESNIVELKRQFEKDKKAWTEIATLQINNSNSIQYNNINHKSQVSFNLNSNQNINKTLSSSKDRHYNVTHSQDQATQKDKYKVNTSNRNKPQQPTTQDGFAQTELDDDDIKSNISITTNNGNNKIKSSYYYVKDFYGILKSIYQEIQNKGKKYNSDFNNIQGEHENINYSICYENDNDENKLYNVCQQFHKDISFLFNQLIVNFEKIKTTMTNKIQTWNEENKKLAKQWYEFKHSINDYLWYSTGISSNLYNTADVLKIFKKNYTSIKENNTAYHNRSGSGSKFNNDKYSEKEIKAWKLMVNTYKHALQDSLNKNRWLEDNWFSEENLNKSMSSRNNNNDFNWDEFNDNKWLHNQLKIIKAELKEKKQENEFWKSKLNSTNSDNDRNPPKEKIKNESNTCIMDSAGMICNAIEKWVNEITVTPKIREYLDVIFKWIGFSEEDLNTVLSKKKKSYLSIFK